MFPPSEAQVASHRSVAEDECRRVYESERSQFELSPRFRARHIFVAAPDGSAPAITLAQGSVAQGLSIRLLAGEEFAEVAAAASEDEATKRNGGDLDYFSTQRVPPEFVAKLEELTVGDTSPPLQSHLGFHIVRLMEKLPARALSFDEVRAEIAAGIANQKRATEVAALREWVKKPERIRQGAVPP